MKPLTVFIQVSAVVVVLALSYYLGRPIYFESLVKAQDAASQASLTGNLLCQSHFRFRVEAADPYAISNYLLTLLA